MTLSEWTLSHRRSILFLVALLAIGGIFGGLNLPVALFPHVDFPRVVVSLDAGDRPADRMALEVTWPVEEAVRSVPGVRDVRSTTSRGSAEISVNFDWGQDMIVAAQQIEAAVNQSLPMLPTGTTFSVRRMDPTIFPVLAYSLTSNLRPQTEIRDLALFQIRPALSSVSGVSRVGILGGELDEYHVIVDPSKLMSFGLTMADVSKALAAANVLQAIGRLEDHYKLFLVVTDTSLKTLEEIKSTVIRAGSTGVVLVDDVAVVSRSTVPQWIRVTADGRDAVIVQVYQQPGANTVQIARELKARLAALRSHLPPDVAVSNWYDQSGLILASATSVRDSVLVGVALAALVLLVFLRNVKVTLIAIMTVPAVLAAATLLLYVFGMSFNIMTLGGMAAAVGLIIDDVIVMVEHIVRRMRASGEPVRRNVIEIASEFTRPLLSSSLSTTVIFLPLAFLSGVTGAFFKALSVTMAASLVVSFFIGWMAVPLVANHFLSMGDVHQEEGGRLTRGIHAVYAAIMGPLLRHPWAIGLIILPMLFAGWSSYGNLKSGFMPSMDEGGFILDYNASPGTALSETDRLLRQVEQLLQATPEVETYSRRTGLQLGGGITEANQGDFFVRLRAFPRRPIDQIMEDVRLRVEASVPGVRIEMAQLMEDLIGDLTAVPQPIEVKVYSDDTAALRSLGPQIAQLISSVSGVVDVKDGITLAGDALEIQVDRVRAALEGVDPDAVSRQVADQLTGLVTTNIQQGQKMVGVRVWLPAGDRKREAQLGAFSIRAADGHVFPLRRVATMSTLTGQPQITRENLKQMIAVTGRISGRDMGSTVRDVKAVLDSSGLFTGAVTYELGGLYQQQQIAFRGLLGVLIAAVVLVFLLLLFVYESFKVALAILTTTLLALPAVFFGLRLTGGELNISSMMGMTMIVGIVTEVAIFYCSAFFELNQMVGLERLITAGTNRMRPIAMTTLAAILALLPLALGIGQGSAMQQPLAVAIISGLLVQLPLVLMVLPALMMLFRVGNEARA